MKDQEPDLLSSRWPCCLEHEHVLWPTDENAGWCPKGRHWIELAETWKMLTDLRRMDAGAARAWLRAYRAKPSGRS